MTADESNNRTQITQNIMPPTIPAVSSSATIATDTGTGTGNGAGTGNVVTSIELTENFYINNKKKNNFKVQVKLSKSGIYLRRETTKQNNINEQLIRMDDIIGSRCGPRLRKRVRGSLSSCKRNISEKENESDGNTDNKTGIEAQEKDTSAYLYIYAYLKPEKLSAPRKRTVRILRFRSCESFEENLKSAERWYQGIRANKSRSMAKTEEPKPLLVLLNPKSGSGKGRELFQRQVAPILKEAEAHYDLQITTHANYARDFVKCHKGLAQCYSGIVVASGDGLFYEVLNGLMERTDWHNMCRKLPIGIIPCGSGNGLAASIAHLYNEPYEPKPIMHAALTCVAGNTTAMDIVRVELAKLGNKPIEIYSFLSIGWGLIADIDIESERFRSIGAQRFTLWSIHRLISLRTYKGKLSYLPWKRENANLQGEQSVKTTPKTNEQVTRTTVDANQLNNEFHDVEEMMQQFNDNEFFADAVSLDASSYRPHTDSWHSTASRRTAYYSIAGQSMHSRQSVTASILSKLETINAEFEQRIPEPPKSTIPPLNMPLPDNWICEDSDFIMVHAAYTTHLAADCFFAPESRLNDGIIFLVIIRAGCGRSQLLQFLLGMSTGTHIPGTPNDFIQVIPVHAFRIEPHGEDGIIAVDGERVDYGPIQAEILPGMINVMVPSGK